MTRNNLDIEIIKHLYLKKNIHPRDIAKILNTSKNKIIRIIKTQGFEKSDRQKKIEAQEKRVQSYLNKYGVTSPLKSSEILTKVQQTNLERYGSICSLNNTEIKNKKLKTYQNNWGCHPKESHITNLHQLNKDYVLSHFIKNGELDFEAFINYFNISAIKGRRLKHEWNIEYLKNKTLQHKQEQEIYNYIKNLIEEKVLYQERKVLNPKELDIYIPDKRIAIEFDGIMYHSFGYHNLKRFNNTEEEKFAKKDHQMKTELCEQNGIQLFHIFENEWRKNTEVWKSVLANSLGVIRNKIYARKCEIKEVKSKIAKEFLDKNHLQGNCPAKIKLGLFYQDELIALMTFGKPRFNKKYEYELLRFCCKINTSIIGGASKLFKHFIKIYNPKSIISYANRRWSKGDLYYKLGFKLLSKTKPGYYYFHIKDRFKLLSRNKFQKYKLPTILKDFNPKLSETKNMYNHGFRKIYDSGQLVFVMIL